MTEVFVICNQLGHFWGKSKTWVDGSVARAVARARHRDEASNILFELSSKDFELRGDIVVAQLNSKGDPIVEVSNIPLPAVPVVEENQQAEEQAAVNPEHDSVAGEIEDTTTQEN